MKVMLLGLILMGFSGLQVQDFKEISQLKVSRFGFMAGNWEGEGAMTQGPGTGTVTQVTEEVYFDVDSTVLVFRGIGKLASGEKVHDALGVLYYDHFKKSVKINTWVSKGMHTQASVEWLGDQHFRWFFDAGPDREIRYTIRVKDDIWHEQGEISTDSDDSWTLFFEMKLSRVD
ncbi:hypothetical protein [Marinoscillum furvescens]|uniref:DUF1579 domain-containing protein n=1 Tax=Marinoscillum furvescens DSM 4134 TaxID=1122208 RepID=A0A3D9L3G9_MARFU|nr:hypothetical protein [Marinoscillum furvescens]RED99836.1 hypothetical protein C7460_107119 [Marinoscillum furvescens DSM 4134]